MKNKVVVTIAGQEYTMVAVEDEAYVRKCADYVDSQLRDIMSNKLPKETAAVLAAMNMPPRISAARSRRIWRRPAG